MRLARLVLLPVAGAGLLVGAAGLGAASASPSTPGAPPTTVAPVASTTTVPAGVAVPAAEAGVVAVRVGSSVGGLDKTADEGAWSVRRIVTSTAVAVVALALAGYVYGRVASAH